MTESFNASELNATDTGTVNRNLNKIIAIASGLVAVNILLMLAMSYVPPIVGLSAILFGNVFVGMAVFAITVGGGFWISSKGTESGNLPLAGAGVSLTQLGYGLFGALILGVAPAALRLPAIGISVVLTAIVTAIITFVVFNTDRNFSSWQSYSFYCFIAGFAVVAVGYFTTPLVMAMGGFIFFVAFVVDLTYEIWAVKANRYASDLRNAIGIYVAVMGVFIHILQWVIRILSMLSE